MGDSRFSALKALWTVKAEYRGAKSAIATDLATYPWLERLKLRIGCTAAIILNRGPITPTPGLPNARSSLRHSIYAVSMVWWDLRSDSYGWACRTLEFHPWQFRFSLDSDGDGYL